MKKPIDALDSTKYIDDAVSVKQANSCGTPTSENARSSIFDNRKRWIKAQDVARELGISVRTVYDWHHRPHRRNTPPGLFNKFNGHLFLSTEALNLWMTQQANRRPRR